MNILQRILYFITGLMYAGVGAFLMASALGLKFSGAYAFIQSDLYVIAGGIGLFLVGIVFFLYGFKILKKNLWTDISIYLSLIYLILLILSTWLGIFVLALNFPMYVMFVVLILSFFIGFVVSLFKK